MGKDIEPVELQGIVKRYSGNGRKLNYPTANIASQTNLANGVYFGFADLADYKNHPALVFIGTPVTVGGRDRRVEAHLLDIEDRDYYGEKLILSLRHFWRPNEKFGSIDELKAAMKNDEVTGRKWFKKKRTVRTMD